MEKFKRLRREYEISIDLYCEHLSEFGKNYIINSNGKKVCKECCNHASGFKPFINHDIKEVCCEHRRTTEDNAGNRYCTECFEMLPQLYNYGPKKEKRGRKK